MKPQAKRLIVGMTGATGAIFGIRILQALRDTEVETHLVVSKWAQQTIEHETSFSLEDVRSLADATYSSGDMGAKISSGSFRAQGMVIIPCSMRTVAAIARGVGDNLVHRAADVILKERRRLVIVPRETPLNDVHLENMLILSRMGVAVVPPVPAFYNHPQTLDDMVNHIVMRVLDQLNIPNDLAERWDGKMKGRESRLRPIATSTP